MQFKIAANVQLSKGDTDGIEQKYSKNISKRNQERN